MERVIIAVAIWTSFISCSQSQTFPGENVMQINSDAKTIVVLEYDILTERFKLAAYDKSYYQLFQLKLPSDTYRLDSIDKQNIFMSRLIFARGTSGRDSIYSPFYRGTYTVHLKNIYLQGSGLGKDLWVADFNRNENVVSFSDSTGKVIQINLKRISLENKELQYEKIQDNLIRYHKLKSKTDLYRKFVNSF